jgi:hypothetical protein
MPSSRQLLAISTFVIAIGLLLQIFSSEVYKPINMPPHWLTTSPLLRRLPHTPRRTFSPYSLAGSIQSIPNSFRAFSSASTMSSKSFHDAVQERRSYYALNKESPISDKQLSKIIKDAVLYTPSSFNSQSSRIVVLLAAEHDKFWEITKEVLKPNVPDADQFATTVKKLDGFKAGYGTVCMSKELGVTASLTIKYRSCSSKIRTQFKNSSMRSHFTRINSPNGASTLQPCTNTSSGLASKPKDSVATFSM